MFGIILKDYYESFCIKKNLIGFLFSIACLIFLTIFVQNMYALVLMIVITLPMISVSPLQYSLEQDEISNYDKILLTFPLTRKEIVSSKLLGTYIFAVLANFCISSYFIDLRMHLSNCRFPKRNVDFSIWRDHEPDHAPHQQCRFFLAW